MDTQISDPHSCLCYIIKFYSDDNDYYFGYVGLSPELRQDVLMLFMQMENIFYRIR